MSKTGGIDMNDLLFQIVSVLVSGMGVSVGLTDIIRRLIQKGNSQSLIFQKRLKKSLLS